MKAILQVGPAQFVIEGATFGLLCEDIEQTLSSLVKLQESTISLTLHVRALELFVKEDSRRLAAAGMPLPDILPSDGDEEEDADDGADSSNGRSRTLSKSPRGGQRMRPPVTSTHKLRHGGPLFIYSAESFDVAEAVVQRLRARMLEQRLLLEELATLPVEQDGEADSCAVSARVLPLPILQLDRYLSTSAAILPEFDAAGHRRRHYSTVGHEGEGGQRMGRSSASRSIE